ncbi:MAG: hypothetical protein ACXV5R_00020 [Candidatus Angelobacter sp.]
MKQLTEGHVEWTMAAPLWRQTGDPTVTENRVKFRTPTILRFATDTFMDEFHNLLSTEPQRLSEYVAAPEAWNAPPNEPVPSPQKSGLALVLTRARNRTVQRLQARGSRVIGASSTSSSTDGRRILKLYQPAHQRYYMVTTCLVCRMLGLPDRKIDAGAQEKASFVVRMLQPHSSADKIAPDPRDCDEFALVNKQWQSVSNPGTLINGEERHPLSPAAYIEDDLRKRRLLVGLIPVGDRERLIQAGQPNPAGADPLPSPVDTRQMLLKTQVIGPMKNLEDVADRTFAAFQPPDLTKNPKPAPLTSDQETARIAAIPSILRNGNDQIQQVSWYVLLDLARYFETNLNDLWQAVQGGDGSGLHDPLKPIWDVLSGATHAGMTMVTALQKAYAAATLLESARTTYQTQTTDGTDGTAGWPTFLFPFYTVDAAGKHGLPGLSTKDDRDAFETKITTAVQAIAPTPSQPLPPRLVAQANANPQGPVWFTVRCVLERPNCAALTPPLVSEPTIAFQLAGFFDPDAPARPIRIGLPIDTTPAGLRKFDKNTAFVMSDTLCGQVSKMGGMSFGDLIMSVLPFPFHQDLSGGGGKPCGNGISAGMVCSFSLPIITIVALILLVIFVKLLDIIFFWMPFFQICLPLPKFSAKDS